LRTARRRIRQQLGQERAASRDALGEFGILARVKHANARAEHDERASLLRVQCADVRCGINPQRQSAHNRQAALRTGLTTLDTF
jgi:hypothetical protein